MTAMSSALPLLDDLLACLLGYMIGAIPFGYLVFYAARGIDIRTVGSGNIGATNAARAGGRSLGLLVLALDVLKAVLPVLLTRRLLRGQPGAEAWVTAAAGAAFAGHVCRCGTYSRIRTAVALAARLGGGR